jgi:hypothetical protein
MFETIKYPFIHSFLSLYTCKVTPGMGATRRSMTIQFEGAPGGHSRGGGCRRGGGWQLGPVIRLNLCCNKKKSNLCQLRWSIGNGKIAKRTSTVLPFAP